MNNLIEASKHSLLQLKSFLSQLTNDEYEENLSIFSGSSIGMHNRHIIEFYQCLLIGVPNGKLNYDQRQRNLLLETDLFKAINAIDVIIENLFHLKNDEPILLHAKYDTGTQIEILPTSISRELSYVLEHAIHHMAILKIGCLAACPHLKFEQDFGVAYSTIKYRNSVHSNLSA